MTNESGFNLIELMVVIAIMAILAAIAVPAYSHYINKSRAIAAMVLTDPVRNAVVEYAMLHNGDLSLVSNETLNLPSKDLVEGSNDVNAINIESQGAATAAIIAELADNLGTLTWTGTYNTSSGHLVWQCTYPAGSALAHYAPAHCTAA